MTPEVFVQKWRGVELSEVAASHDHFNELCELLEIGKPTDEDPKGEWFAFEKPVPKGGKAGGAGYADVWRRKCFVWEYKRKKKYNTLAAAIAQARDYASLLDNPPLAIACDIDEIQIRTLFTGSVSVTHTVRLLDLNDAGKRQLLRRCFTDPGSLRPDITPQAVTEEAARKFATLAQNLRERRDRIGQLHDARRVAHFLNKVVFCLFAEDAGLLPGNVISAIVEESLKDKTGLSQMLADLFDKMRTGKGYFGAVRIPWFNGSLFDDDDVLELLFPEVQTLGEAMRLDWASIEPVIFGTLFERGLDAERRKEMARLFDVAAAKLPKIRRKKAEAASAASLPLRGGATAAQRSLGKGVGIHYTDPATIMKIVEPVVLRPLAAEWEMVKAAVGKAKGTAKKDEIYLRFRERLSEFRVLDPACGSGNFLYLALRHLKDFDRDVEREAKRYIATPTVAKYRLFKTLPASVCPDHQLIVIASDEYTLFGIVHSLPHELWALRLGTWLGVGNDPRYTPSTTFETFPFPEGLAPNLPAESLRTHGLAKRITDAAVHLDELRENWLNPADLVKREPEVASGYPDRLLPKGLVAQDQLKKRTLTNLYNQRPTWLADAHRKLDRTVAAAYGWPETLVDRAQPENADDADRTTAEDEILKCLFDLNQERAKAGR